MGIKKKIAILALLVTLISCGGGGGGGGGTSSPTPSIPSTPSTPSTPPSTPSTPSAPVESSKDSNGNIKWNDKTRTYDKTNPNNQTVSPTINGAGVTVGVLDMGFGTTDPDLITEMNNRFGSSPTGRLERKTNFGVATPHENHGIVVAGVVGGNSIGIAKKVNIIGVDVSKYEYDAALHYGLGKEKQHIIYSGIEVDKEPIDPSIHLMKNALNLLFVGRFDPQKGVDYLLDIFNKCQRLDIHLTLIGDNVIGGLNIEKKNTNRITFLGWVPHESLCSYYATCDAVIMPSRWEAFGLVAVEAMKYGKPVIVSSRGALTEIIKDKETGYVFDFKDPNSLLNILNDLDLSVLKKMGSSAEDHFKRYFQAESMIKKTIALYKDIVS